MKKPAWGDAGGRGDKSRISGAKLLDLQPAYGTTPARIELTDALAEQVALLQMIYGRVPFLTPAACASCTVALAPGPRDTLSVGVLNSEPIIFFLCPSCFEATLNGYGEVNERVYERIDALAAFQAQMSRNAEA